MADLTCIACGGSRVVPDAVVLDWGSQSVGPLTVQADRRNPVSTNFLGSIPGVESKVTGTLRARLCADCGHADLYSPEAEQMWRGYVGEA